MSKLRLRSALQKNKNILHIKFALPFNFPLHVCRNTKTILHVITVPLTVFIANTSYKIPNTQFCFICKQSNNGTDANIAPRDPKGTANISLS